MDHLDRADFVSCDDQHRLGLAGVFLPEIAGAGMFPPGTLDAVLGGGLFAARKKLFTEETLFAGIREAAFVKNLLDFSRGGSELPVLNYLVLTSVKRRLNLYRDAPGEPRMRASTRGFRRRGDVLVDPAAGRELRYLHWAGAGIGPGYPYWSTFRHYRFLRGDLPRALQLPDPPRGLARRLTHRLRDALRRLPKPASRSSG
jgi:hypothetical protein